MTAHAYWGLMLWSRGTGCAVAELQLRTTPSGASATTGGSAGASGADSGYAAAQAFDGDTATAWALTGAGALRLSYAFGAPVAITEVYLRMPGAASGRPGSSHAPGLAFIVYSDDGNNWRYGNGLANLTALGDDGEATFAVSDALPAMAVQDVHWVDQRFPWPESSVAVRELSWSFDHADGGSYRLAGTDVIDATPVVPIASKVSVYNQRTNRLVAVRFTEAGVGTWEVRGLAPGDYRVVASDLARLYDPVARDGVAAVP